MSSFLLKCIAMFTMVIDHLGNSIFEYTNFMNLIGRIAFPIFAFQISEGYLHTKNLKKYFFRLFLFALISQVPFYLFRTLYTEGFALNIFFTLLLGLLAIFIYDKIINSDFDISKTFENTNMLFKYFLGLFIVVIIGIIAELIKVDYGFFGICIIFLFYMFKNNKLALIISYLTVCIIKYGINIILYGFHYLYILLCLFTILPIVFIILYNGKQGRKIKYLLYLFYPVHLLVLYFLFR